ncbi:MAG: hypothetical protein L6416_00455, partial [Candidatus Omnitrophica bacterium]|nr:hypothetical protein [Candidatus Omnitrophota bacterium]
QLGERGDKIDFAQAKSKLTMNLNGQFVTAKDIQVTKNGSYIHAGAQVQLINPQTKQFECVQGIYHISKDDFITGYSQLETVSQVSTQKGDVKAKIQFNREKDLSVELHLDNEVAGKFTLTNGDVCFSKDAGIYVADGWIVNVHGSEDLNNFVHIGGKDIKQGDVKISGGQAHFISNGVIAAGPFDVDVTVNLSVKNDISTVENTIAHYRISDSDIHNKTTIVLNEKLGLTATAEKIDNKNQLGLYLNGNKIENYATTEYISKADIIKNEKDTSGNKLITLFNINGQVMSQITADKCRLGELTVAKGMLWMQSAYDVKTGLETNRNVIISVDKTGLKAEYGIMSDFKYNENNEITGYKLDTKDHVFTYENNNLIQYQAKNSDDINRIEAVKEDLFKGTDLESSGKGVVGSSEIKALQSYLGNVSVDGIFGLQTQQACINLLKNSSSISNLLGNNLMNVGIFNVFMDEAGRGQLKQFYEKYENAKALTENFKVSFDAKEIKETASEKPKEYENKNFKGTIQNIKNDKDEDNYILNGTFKSDNGAVIKGQVTLDKDQNVLAASGKAYLDITNKDLGAILGNNKLNISIKNLSAQAVDNLVEIGTLSDNMTILLNKDINLHVSSKGNDLVILGSYQGIQAELAFSQGGLVLLNGVYELNQRTIIPSQDKTSGSAGGMPQRADWTSITKATITGNEKDGYVLTNGRVQVKDGRELIFNTRGAKLTVGEGGFRQGKYVYDKGTLLIGDQNGELQAQLGATGYEAVEIFKEKGELLVSAKINFKVNEEGKKIFNKAEILKNNSDKINTVSLTSYGGKAGTILNVKADIELDDTSSGQKLTQNIIIQFVPGESKVTTKTVWRWKDNSTEVVRTISEINFDSISFIKNNKEYKFYETCAGEFTPLYKEASTVGQLQDKTLAINQHFYKIGFNEVNNVNDKVRIIYDIGNTVIGLEGDSVGFDRYGKRQTGVYLRQVNEKGKTIKDGGGMLLMLNGNRISMEKDGSISIQNAKCLTLTKFYSGVENPWITKSPAGAGESGTKENEIDIYMNTFEKDTINEVVVETGQLITIENNQWVLVDNDRINNIGDKNITVINSNGTRALVEAGSSAQVTNGEVETHIGGITADYNSYFSRYGLRILDAIGAGTKIAFGWAAERSSQGKMSAGYLAMLSFEAIGIGLAGGFAAAFGTNAIVSGGAAMLSSYGTSKALFTAAGKKALIEMGIWGSAMAGITEVSIISSAIKNDRLASLNAGDLLTEMAKSFIYGALVVGTWSAVLNGALKLVSFIPQGVSLFSGAEAAALFKGNVFTRLFKRGIANFGLGKWNTPEAARLLGTTSKFWSHEIMAKSFSMIASTMLRNGFGVAHFSVTFHVFGKGLNVLFEAAGLGDSKHALIAPLREFGQGSLVEGIVQGFGFGLMLAPFSGIMQKFELFTTSNFSKFSRTLYSVPGAGKGADVIAKVFGKSFQGAVHTGAIFGLIAAGTTGFNIAFLPNKDISFTEALQQISIAFGVGLVGGILFSLTGSAFKAGGKYLGKEAKKTAGKLLGSFKTNMAAVGQEAYVEGTVSNLLQLAGVDRIWSEMIVECLPGPGGVNNPLTRKTGMNTVYNNYQGTGSLKKQTNQISLAKLEQADKNLSTKLGQLEKDFGLDPGKLTGNMNNFNITDVANETKMETETVYEKLDITAGVIMEAKGWNAKQFNIELEASGLTLVDNVVYDGTNLGDFSEYNGLHREYLAEQMTVGEVKQAFSEQQQSEFGILNNVNNNTKLKNIETPKGLSEAEAKGFETQLDALKTEVNKISLRSYAAATIKDIRKEDKDKTKSEILAKDRGFELKASFISASALFGVYTQATGQIINSQFWQQHGVSETNLLNILENITGRSIEDGLRTANILGEGEKLANNTDISLIAEEASQKSAVISEAVVKKLNISSANFNEAKQIVREYLGDIKTMTEELNYCFKETAELKHADVEKAVNESKADAVSVLAAEAVVTKLNIPSADFNKAKEIVSKYLGDIKTMTQELNSCFKETLKLKQTDVTQVVNESKAGAVERISDIKKEVSGLGKDSHMTELLDKLYINVEDLISMDKSLQTENKKKEFGEKHNISILPVFSLELSALKNSDINRTLKSMLKGEKAVMFSLIDENNNIVLDFHDASGIKVRPVNEEGALILTVKQGVKEKEFKLSITEEGKVNIKQMTVSINGNRFRVVSDAGEKGHTIYRLDQNYGDTDARKMAKEINDYAETFESTRGFNFSMRNEVNQLQKALDFAFDKNTLWEVPAGTGKTKVLFTFASALAVKYCDKKVVNILHNKPLFEDAKQDDAGQRGEFYKKLGIDSISFGAEDLNALMAGGKEADTVIKKIHDNHVIYIEADTWGFFALDAQLGSKWSEKGQGLKAKQAYKMMFENAKVFHDEVDTAFSKNRFQQGIDPQGLLDNQIRAIEFIDNFILNTEIGGVKINDTKAPQTAARKEKDAAAKNRVNTQRQLLTYYVLGREGESKGEKSYKEYKELDDKYNYDVIGVAFNTTVKEALIKKLNNNSFKDAKGNIVQFNNILTLKEGDITAKAGQKLNTEQEKALNLIKASLAGRVKVLRLYEGRNVGYSKEKGLIRPYANKTLAPDLQVGDPYIAGHTEMVFKDLLAESIKLENPEHAKPLLNKVEISGKARVTTMARAVIMAQKLGADFCGYSGTVSPVSEMAGLFFGLNISPHKNRYGRTPQSRLVTGDNLSIESHVNALEGLNAIKLNDKNSRSVHVILDGQADVDEIEHKLAMIEKYKAAGFTVIVKDQLTEWDIIRQGEDKPKTVSTEKIQEYVEKRAENEKVVYFFNLSACRGTDVSLASKLIQGDVEVHAFFNERTTDYDAEQLIRRDRGKKILDPDGKYNFVYQDANGREVFEDGGGKYKPVYNPLTVHYISEKTDHQRAPPKGIELLDTFKKNGANERKNMLYNGLSDIYDSVTVIFLENLRESAKSKPEADIISKLITKFQNPEGIDANITLQTTAQNGRDALQKKIDGVVKFLDENLTQNTELRQSLSSGNKQKIEELIAARPTLNLKGTASPSEKMNAKPIALCADLSKAVNSTNILIKDSDLPDIAPMSGPALSKTRAENWSKVENTKLQSIDQDSRNALKQGLEKQGFKVDDRLTQSGVHIVNTFVQLKESSQKTRENLAFVAEGVSGQKFDTNKDIKLIAMLFLLIGGDDDLLSVHEYSPASLNRLSNAANIIADLGEMLDGTIIKSLKNVQNSNEPLALAKAVAGSVKKNNYSQFYKALNNKINMLERVQKNLDGTQQKVNYLEKEISRLGRELSGAQAQEGTLLRLEKKADAFISRAEKSIEKSAKVKEDTQEKMVTTEKQGITDRIASFLDRSVVTDVEQKAEILKQEGLLTDEKNQDTKATKSSIFQNIGLFAALFIRNNQYNNAKQKLEIIEKTKGIFAPTIAELENIADKSYDNVKSPLDLGIMFNQDISAKKYEQMEEIGNILTGMESQLPKEKQGAVGSLNINNLMDFSTLDEPTKNKVIEIIHKQGIHVSLEGLNEFKQQVNSLRMMAEYGLTQLSPESGFGAAAKIMDSFNENINQSGKKMTLEQKLSLANWVSGSDFSEADYFISLGDTAVKENNNVAAESYYQKVMDSDKAKVSKKLNAGLKLAELYLSQGQPVKAKQSLIRAVEAADSGKVSENPIIQEQTDKMYFDSCIKLGNISLESSYKQDKDGTIKVDIAVVKQAQVYYEQALKKAEDLGTEARIGALKGLNNVDIVTTAYYEPKPGEQEKVDELYEKQLENCEKLLELDPENTTHYKHQISGVSLKKAEFKVLNGELEEAKKILMSNVLLSPAAIETEVEAYNILGDIALKQKDNLTAKQMYQNAQFRAYQSNDMQLFKDMTKTLAKIDSNNQVLSNVE